MSKILSQFIPRHSVDLTLACCRMWHWHSTQRDTVVGCFICCRWSSSLDGPQVNLPLKTAKMAYLPKCVCDHCDRFIPTWGNTINFMFANGVVWVRLTACAAFDAHSLRHLWQGWMGGANHYPLSFPAKHRKTWETHRASCCSTFRKRTWQTHTD